jgi:hypothetical protein
MCRSPIRCDFAAAALDQHGVAHDRGARRGAGDDAAGLVDLPHPPLDRRVPDLARDPELVAAGEEHAGGPVEDAGQLAVEGLGAGQ